MRKFRAFANKTEPRVTSTFVDRQWYISVRSRFRSRQADPAGGHGATSRMARIGCRRSAVFRRVLGCQLCAWLRRIGLIPTNVSAVLGVPAPSQARGSRGSCRRPCAGVVRMTSWSSTPIRRNMRGCLAFPIAVIAFRRSSSSTAASDSAVEDVGRNPRRAGRAAAQSRPFSRLLFVRDASSIPATAASEFTREGHGGNFG